MHNRWRGLWVSSWFSRDPLPTFTSSYFLQVSLQIYLVIRTEQKGSRLHPYYKMNGFNLKKNAHSGTSLKSSFRRRFVSINLEKENKEEIRDIKPGETVSLAEDQCTALVVNSSFAMAKEITLAITLKMPDCSIMYAPGLEVAKWILKRRKITLVVASATLPDGHISSLIPVCESLSPPPDLVVVGSDHLGGHIGQHKGGLEGHNQTQGLYSPVTYFGEGFKPVINQGNKNIERKIERRTITTEDSVKELGADIRNDLNNPLQEIVSMVFVAKAGRELSPNTLQALEAIDRAAKGLASTVSTLEDRIRTKIV